MTRSPGRWFLFVLLAGLAVMARAQVPAESQWPARVGRLVEVQGTAWVYDRDDSAWVQAEHNRPVTTGDRIGTDRDSRLELRIGSIVVRLAGETDIAMRRLDERAIAIELFAGSLALRVTAPDVASQVEVTTAEGRFAPASVGHFRIDRRGEVSEGSAWRGSLQFEGRDSRLAVGTGQHGEFWLEGPQPATHYRWLPIEQDEFAAWAVADDRDADRLVPPREVSPEMTGWEDLDRHGRWRWHPEYGRVWTPYDVPAGWAPYTLGRWTWISPWGWTWIDVAPWGFAPFHYGRWVSWGGRWVWVPGPRGARPVFLPGVVDWVFPPYIPGRRPPPPSHWRPLPPRKDFRPHPHPFPSPRDHGVIPPRHDRVVPPPRHDRVVPPRGPATGPAAEVPYTPQGVPGGVTRTPRDAFVIPPGGASEPGRVRPIRPGPGHPAPPDGAPRPRPRPEPPGGSLQPRPHPMPVPPPGPVMGGGAAPGRGAPPAPAATEPPRTGPPVTGPTIAPLPRPGLGPTSPPPPTAPTPPPAGAAPRPPAVAPTPPPAGAAPRPPAGPREERSPPPDRGERATPKAPPDKPAQDEDARKRAPERGGGRNEPQKEK